MKKQLLFLLTFSVTSLFAQKPLLFQPYYSKVSKILWESDTLFIKGENAPINTSGLEIRVLPSTYSCEIFFYNNLDTPIEVDWTHVSFKFDNIFILLNLKKPIKLTEQQQIQKIPINGKVAHSFQSVLGEQLLNLKEVKEQYKKTKEPVPVTLEVIITVIYNEEEIKIHKIENGVYNQKYQK